MTKIKIDKFTKKNGGKDDPMNCILRKDGWMYASDGNARIKLKADYPESEEGRCFMKNGMEFCGKFPDVSKWCKETGMQETGKYRFDFKILRKLMQNKTEIVTNGAYKTKTKCLEYIAIVKNGKHIVTIPMAAIDKMSWWLEEYGCNVFTYDSGENEVLVRMKSFAGSILDVDGVKDNSEREYTEESITKGNSNVGIYDVGSGMAYSTKTIEICEGDETYIETRKYESEIA